jgi:hypothetical protein
MTPQEHNDIVRRFFDALESLKMSGSIRGLKTFTDRYGIDRSSMIRAKSCPENYGFKAVWLTYLVRDYGINAAWLLTGEGQMHD